MIRAAKYVSLAVLTCATTSAAAQSDSENSAQVTVPRGASRAVAAGIFPGRVEGCAINPPLALFSENIAQTKEDGDYLLRPRPASNGSVTVAALVGEADSNDRQPTALVVDKLSLSTGELRSATGQTWKVFGMPNSDTASVVRLTARRTDYSVCRLSNAVVINNDTTIGHIAAYSALIGSIASGSTVSALDILGLKSNSYVRLRLRSSPSQADIFLNGIRQPPQTDTVLDVIAAVIPHIRIQKEGYEPCSLGKRNLTFEDGSKRILNASCQLVPKKRKSRR